MALEKKALEKKALERNVADRLNTQALSEQDDNNWLAHGNTYYEQRYSGLDSINDQNVNTLGLSWSFDTEYSRGLEGTPIVVDGVMFVTGNWNMVYALDAVTGKLLWKYDPKVPREWAKMACCDVINRGVAVYEGKVITATLDARLIALDAKDGHLLWETQTADLKEYPYSITGAPRVYKDKVVIGNSGAEYGVRGFVSAFDVNTGKQVWRFYTVPGNPAEGFESPAMEMAAKTWTGEWWKFGGGGTAWDSIVYDPDLDQLYIGVGNGSPWNQKIRSPGGGDNLFLSSIVAVNPDSGEYLWHYQETPGETWDFTATQPIMLADMQWQGKTRKVIWHAPKNGFFFIIDRENGELLSAEPFAKVNWASHYDMETGRPVETEFARYTEKPELILPGSFGAHNWHPMSYSPKTGYVYIPAMETGFTYDDTAPFEHHKGHWNPGVAIGQAGVDSPIFLQLLVEKFLNGSLIAWDPVKQQAAWTLPHAKVGNSGVVSTAGNLVFQGTATGKFEAYSADKGEALWSFDAKTAVMGSPVTFSVNGEQYVTVMAGRGGAFGLLTGEEVFTAPPPSRVLTFKLGGDKALPENPALPPFKAPAPSPDTTEEDIANGRTLYHQFCSVCHGPDVISGRGIPDLRELPPVFYENFDGVVLEGMMSKAGMVGFSDVLDKAQADDIKAYILNEAAKKQALENTPKWWLNIQTWFYSLLTELIGLLAKLA
ncbi:PQQ-dependent dehydrogenase, methanol/ethanol family [Spongiibacter sp. KMU-158]|uniref:PQQ-dependent dehydrogenase, methanol/ethanol family n=1 Tax=Spongiibacter pelagi TaxID=2760804 RepID=A0A927C3L0_9GAMM|nr:PQQ-dependent dehydrogenase, methanol/ethanol family [Spongiibacter pelagi]